MTEKRLRHKIIVGVIPFEGNLNLLSGQENRKMINLDHGYVKGVDILLKRQKDYYVGHSYNKTIEASIKLL